MIPALIGLFGVPSRIESLKSKHALTTNYLGKKDFHIFNFLRENIVYIFRWATIGVGIGALPGVGENVAAFMAYSEAKKSHPDRERFGTGEYAGVAAPETANNAAVGGAILPMLTLGIPGSPPAAVLMSAMMLYGLKPGPLLLTNNPEIMPQLMGIFFIATILTILIGSILTKPMVGIFKIKPQLLMPTVACLMVLGAFATRNSIFDIWIMLIFGLLGYTIQKLNYNTAPLVLGMILGPIIDSNFRRVLLRSDGNILGFFQRPISLVFVAIIGISLLIPTLTSKGKNRQNE